ncbi:MAG TPA: YihY/virulence factor BrkB family protein [Anaerolineales bacterium]|jgi:membrane protein|nr:YihY/virulence factor BrkB family protein [Anaerolineales bacterium]
MWTKKISSLLKETLREWSEDNASRLAASLSYYAIFSLAPLLIIAIAIAGFFLGRASVRQEVLLQVRGLVGEGGSKFVQNLIENASRPGASTWAAIIGVATLLLGASGVYGQLQSALNTIWEVEPEPGRGLLNTLIDRFLSFTMVLGTGFLLLISMFASAALTIISNFFRHLLPGTELLWQIIDGVASFAIITLLFAIMFKVLPDVRIEWRDVWIGGAVTALLFTIGKFVIGFYLGNRSVSSAYGAAGSLVAILLWIYYSAQILFFGAEFTQVYSRRYGSRIRPRQGAVSVYEGRRAQRGIPREVELHMRTGKPKGAQAESETPTSEEKS